jgi:hypothetical protein
MPKDHSRDLLKQTKLGLTQIQSFWKYPSDQTCNPHWITKVRDVDKQMTANVKRICKHKYFFRSLSTLYRLSDCRPWRMKQAESWGLRFLAVCAKRRRSVVVLWRVPSHLTNLLKEFEFLITQGSLKVHWDLHFSPCFIYHYVLGSCQVRESMLHLCIISWFFTI